MKILLDQPALDRILPMHIHLAHDGAIRSAGPTMRKLIGPAATFEECLSFERPRPGRRGIADLLRRVDRAGRLILRVREDPMVTLRGHAVPLPDGVLFQLGFGITLVHAVRRYGLTDADFAPSDLVMEFLFLHEANRAVMGELGRASRRLEEAREAAENLALTDPLTGLLNRRGFELALEAALRAAPGTPFALGQLDLDFFKEVNDRHGHAAGDEVLQRVAQILRTETRATDRIARTGGDEFLLLLSGSGSDGDLEALGRRIIRRIEMPIELDDGITCAVSASIGFSRSADHPTLDAAEMLAEADRALYMVKKAGRSNALLARREG